MNCPICHNEMTPGSLLARSESAIFWMKNVEDVPHLLRPKAIRAAGGIILDKKVAPGFFAWERNVTAPERIFSPGRRFYPIFSNRRAIISAAWSRVYLEVSIHRS